MPGFDVFSDEGRNAFATQVAITRKALETAPWEEASKHLEALRAMAQSTADALLTEHLKEHAKDMSGASIKQMMLAIRPGTLDAAHTAHRLSALVYRAHNARRFEYTQHVPMSEAPALVELAGGAHAPRFYSDTHDWDQELLRRIAAQHGPAGKILKNHPNFGWTEEESNHEATSKFWHDYEEKVQPEHFATIKSMMSGQPEELTDHRGQTGSSSSYAHVIPHLEGYAKKAQEAVATDPAITKRSFGGVPHVLVYRGAAGHYAEAMLKAADYDPSRDVVSHKGLALPSAPLSSWTTNVKVAQEFASRHIRDNPETGVIFKKWMPVHDLLHSGFHTVVPGQEHAHTHESELVFRHRDGEVKLPASGISAVRKPGRLKFTPVRAREKPYKAPRPKVERAAAPPESPLEKAEGRRRVLVPLSHEEVYEHAAAKVGTQPALGGQ